jgi:hypothetical protein
VTGFPAPQAQTAPGPAVDLHAATRAIRLADARICRCECVSKWLPGIVWKIILQCWLRSRGAAARI